MVDSMYTQNTIKEVFLKFNVKKTNWVLNISLNNEFVSYTD